MEKFRILPHTADLKIEVFGKDPRDLFKNAMTAMFQAAGYVGEGEILKRKVKCEGMDLPSLLVSFLDEVLYLSEAYEEVYNEINFKNFSEEQLEGILVGSPLKEREMVIKGVTFHEL
ncbi:archease, partial [bacterium]|nr:archease [bacterium]